MFPVGYFASCEIKNADSWILHMSVQERSPQAISVYVTDTTFMFTAEILYDELQKITPGQNITTSLECLRHSIALQNFTLSVPEKKLAFTLKYNAEEVTLSVPLQMIDSDEKIKLLKWILVQLVNRAQANVVLDERKLEAGYLNAVPRFEEASMYMPRVNKPNAVRKRPKGMSIVNPACRKLKIKPGVQFEDD